MVEVTACRASGSQTIRLAPNCSMSRHGVAVIFAALAAGCLLFSTLLAVQGYWVPLPFAGAEVLTLGAALAWVRRELRAAELIAIDRDGVEVRRRDWRGSAAERFERAWVRVELRPGRYRWYPRRLVLTSHGREMEVGAFLAEGERSDLAKRLESALQAAPR